MKAHFLLFLFLTSCTSSNTEKPHFDNKKISIKNKVLTVEIADTPAKRSQGLMNRESLKKNHGMIFVYPEESFHSFWMKNTKIPLSIGFFSKDKTLLEVIDMPVSTDGTFPIYQNKYPAQYALEVPMGWFSKNQIKEKESFSFMENKE